MPPTTSSEDRRERDRRYRSAHRDAIHERQRRYRAANRDRERERARTWREANREKYSAYQQTYVVESRERKRAINLRSKFGLSIEGYKRILAEQSGRCAICRRHQEDIKLTFAVDHDHTTGEIRGLLCQRCNTGIGALGDKQQRLSDALGYLARVEWKRLLNATSQ